MVIRISTLLKENHLKLQGSRLGATRVVYLTESRAVGARQRDDFQGGALRWLCSRAPKHPSSAGESMLRSGSYPASDASAAIQ